MLPKEPTVCGAVTASRMEVKNVMETLQHATNRTAHIVMIATSGAVTVLPENILIIIMSTVPNPVLGV